MLTVGSETAALPYNGGFTAKGRTQRFKSACFRKNTWKGEVGEIPTRAAPNLGETKIELVHPHGNEWEVVGGTQRSHTRTYRRKKKQEAWCVCECV